SRVTGLAHSRSAAGAAHAPRGEGAPRAGLRPAPGRTARHDAAVAQARPELGPALHRVIRASPRLDILPHRLVPPEGLALLHPRQRTRATVPFSRTSTSEAPSGMSTTNSRPPGHRTCTRSGRPPDGPAITWTGLFWDQYPLPA